MIIINEEKKNEMIKEYGQLFDIEERPQKYYFRRRR